MRCLPQATPTSTRATTWRARLKTLGVTTVPLITPTTLSSSKNALTATLLECAYQRCGAAACACEQSGAQAAGTGLPARGSTCTLALKRPPTLQPACVNARLR
eukprot:4382227-Prymnesium_polylepis.7